MKSSTRAPLSAAAIPGVRPVRTVKPVICALSLLIFFSSCVPKARPPAGILPQADEEKALAEAGRLASRGCYTLLKQAHGIYSGLHGRPGLRSRTAEPLLRTCLLLTIREKELGVLSLAYMDEALEILAENPGLARYRPCLDLAGVLWVEGSGLIRNTDSRFSFHKVEAEFRKIEAELKSEASRDDFFAYFYGMFIKTVLNPFDSREELRALGAAFPDSPLLKYLLAQVPRPDAGALEALLGEEPEFLEVSYALGNLAIQSGRLLEAEKNFLIAQSLVPESVPVLVLLGAVAFGLEEFEQSLRCYEKTLALAPESRDGLLGKALSLSSLGRNIEALPVLEEMIRLGFYYMGEAHYWAAWNLHELGRNSEAETHIPESKGRLPTDTAVFALSGILAMERGDLDRAEAEFLESIRFSEANTDSLFRLGTIHAQKGLWEKSADAYLRAAMAFERNAGLLRAKLDEIRRSSFSDERKERLLRRKTAQLLSAEVSAATSYYDAAAGFYNAGSSAKAGDAAGRARGHPAFREKAEELLRKINRRDSSQGSDG